jgi:hydrogenase maturation factor
MAYEVFGLGKLPVRFLQELLQRYGGQDERVIVGPRVGEDAAVLDMGDRYVVAKSDPITFATDEIGSYVVHVNANDIATMGAVPRWFLLTLLLPEKQVSREDVEQIFAQVSQACSALGIVLCGGHTEITHGLDRTIAVGHMLGEVDRGNLVCTAGAKAGDDLILTKGIAIEGTAVLAREIGDRLTEQVGVDLVAQGRRFLQDPGISVLRDAQILCRTGRPHAMHDPTEGGLATGLWEMAQASSKRLVVDLDRVHRFPETSAFCRALGLDPLGLIASGALLAAVSAHESAAMVASLGAAGIRATVIGRVEDGPPLVQLRTGEGLVAMPEFERDELARLFGRG